MPEFILPWQETAAAWLITYLLHSTLLLGSVWLLTRLKLLRSNELRETLWKAALVGGLLTASAQAWWGYQPVSGTFDLLRNPAAAAAHWFQIEPSEKLKEEASGALQRIQPGYGQAITQPPLHFFHNLKPRLEDRFVPLRRDWLRYQFSPDRFGTDGFALHLPQGREGGVQAYSWRSENRSLPEPSQGPSLRLESKRPDPSGNSGSATFVFKVPNPRGDQTASPSDRKVIPLHAANAKDFTFKLKPQSSVWVRGALWVWLLLGGFLGFRVALSKLRLGRLLIPRRPLHRGSMRSMLDELCRSAGTGYVKLSASDRIASPLAAGREICVPRRAESELTPQQQKGMLAHELAHIVRRDSFWLFFSALLQSLFFVQPLNRLARRHICEESEYLCDDWAVRQVGEGRSLARCLAEVAAWIEAAPTPALAAAMAGRDSAIVSRVRRLVGETPRPRRVGLWRRSAAGLVLLALVGGMAPAVNAASGVRVLFQEIEGQQPRHFLFRLEGKYETDPLILQGAPTQGTLRQSPEASEAPKVKKRYFL